MTSNGNGAPDPTTPDAIVVGAGLAGLVSTLELLRSGHTVLLLDRCEPRELGGLAREAFGGMFMVELPRAAPLADPRQRAPRAGRLAADRRAGRRGAVAAPLGRAVRHPRARRRRWLAARAGRALLPRGQLGRAGQLRRRQLRPPLPPHVGHRQGAGRGGVGWDRARPAARGAGGALPRARQQPAGRGGSAWSAARWRGR